VLAVKHFIITVFLFVRNRGDRIVRIAKHYIYSDTDKTTVAVTKRVYRTPIFVLVKQFQEVVCWGGGGADSLGFVSRVKRRKKDAKGASSVRNGIFSEPVKYTSPKYIGQWNGST
jgi:hypothetical protein